MQKNFNGYLFALFAIFFWSFNVIYSKYLSGKLTPFEISFIRWLIPSLLFLPFIGKTVWTYRRKYLKVWPLILAMSFTGLGFQNTFVYYAGHTSNAVDMALIGASSPVFLLIFSALLLHKRITFFQIIGIICALAGVAAVILDGSFTDLSRITLTLSLIHISELDALRRRIFCRLRHSSEKDSAGVAAYRHVYSGNLYFYHTVPAARSF